MIQTIINYFSKGNHSIEDNEEFILFTYRSKIIKSE